MPEVAETIGSLYTGKFQVQGRARPMGGHEGGEDAWVGPVLWSRWYLLQFFFLA